MIKKDFDPDLILAIGGGGLIPARMMRTHLKVPIYVVSVSTYKECKQLDTPQVIQWTDFSQIKNKKILIIDEVDDTRKTLFYIIDKLKNEENIIKTNLGVFVIHNKIKIKSEPDRNLDINYYKSAEEVNDKWIVYPWN